VAEAEDGEVAYNLLNEHRYGMVLLDIRMPKLDGVSLIELMGEMPPVIVHSAFSLSAEDRARLGMKVVQYLHKPVSPQQLLGAVRGVLSGEPGN
jgi:DNA-binding response OmpR family regulator